MNANIVNVEENKIEEQEIKDIKPVKKRSKINILSIISTVVAVGLLLGCIYAEYTISVFPDDRSTMIYYGIMGLGLVSFVSSLISYIRTNSSIYKIFIWIGGVILFLPLIGIIYVSCFEYTEFLIGNELFTNIYRFIVFMSVPVIVIGSVLNEFKKAKISKVFTRLGILVVVSPLVVTVVMGVFTLFESVIN